MGGTIYITSRYLFFYLLIEAHNLTMSDSTILMIMLLAFTTRRMVRSAHLALTPIRFTAPLYFAVPDIYSYEKIHVHTASLGTA